MTNLLETSRTNLVPFESSDLKLFHSINTDEYVRKYLWDDQSIDANTAAELLEQNESHFETNQWGLWKIILKSDDSIAGYTGLWHFFEEAQPQLIYALLEKYTGNGFAKEVAQRILEYARDQLKFDYLVASTDEDLVAFDPKCVLFSLDLIGGTQQITDG